MRTAAWLALLLTAAGCGKVRPSRPPIASSAPADLVITAHPPPGVYRTFSMRVTLEAAQPDVELSWELNADPNGASWYGHSATVKLVESSSIRVLARDADGNLSGPYIFEYRLAPRSGGQCQVVQPERQYYGGGQAVSVEVFYSLPTALSSVEILLDGQPAASYTSVENPHAATTVTFALPAIEKQYEIQCRIATGPAVNVSGNAVFVYVDATPPTAGWAPLGSWQSPTHFRLQAADEGGSQISHVNLCDTSLAYCLPMESAGSGEFLFATAFVAGSGSGFLVTAQIADRAGNTLTLPAAQVFADDFPAMETPWSFPITLTTASVLDLQDYLGAAGGPNPADVRAGDFSLLPPDALPLSPGWNDFFFRPAGKASWETFGIYQAGVAITLPVRNAAATHPWLIYASNSTLPALQANRIATAPVTGASWSRAWFDIPRLLFVEDLNGDGVWDDGDPLYVPDTVDERSGAWLRSAVPLVASLVPLAFQPTAVTQTADIVCADCAAGGTLRLHRRASPFAPPLDRQSFAVTAAAFLQFNGDDQETCSFFWDEDNNGAVNGDEPRSFLKCNSAVHPLVRRESLDLVLAGPSPRVSGIPFGGHVTGVIEVRSGSDELLLRATVPAISDSDGAGSRRVDLPLFGRWPGQFSIWRDGASVSIDLAQAALPASEVAFVEVHDETGQRLSAAIESQLAAFTDYRVFDEAVTTVAVAVGSVLPAHLRALRDGYLSQWRYVWDPVAVLEIISENATGIAAGTVKDSAGNPLAGVHVEWEAYPYSSRTNTNTAGAFRLPVLGSGTLSARTGEGGGVGLAEPVSVSIGVTVNVNFSLPVSGGGSRAQGILTLPGRVEISGSSPVTVYTESPYTWSPLSPGAWKISATPTARQVFTTPGAIPNFDLQNATTLSVPWSAALVAASQTLRCGAREQEILIEALPRVDVACWDWYAQWESQLFYLGRPDPQFGFPQAGFKIWSATLMDGDVPAAYLGVRLRDMIFDRVIEAVTDAVGTAQVALPQGYYRVEAEDGRIFKTATGKTAWVEVSHLGLGSSWFYLP